MRKIQNPHTPACGRQARAACGAPGWLPSRKQLTLWSGPNNKRSCHSYLVQAGGIAMKVRYGLKWFQGSMTKAARPCLHAVFAGASLLLCMVPASALAQQRTAGRGIISRSLPDATLPHSDPQNSAQQTPPPEGSASVAGTVLDVSGAAVPGASVSLLHGDGTQLLTMVSEANGEFNFTKIPAGSYLATVNPYGFAPFAPPEFAVAVQQDYEVPDVSLSIAPANMEVTVRPTDLIAAEQIRAEEKQRLVGVIPNFYTSYIHDAAPLNWR